MLRVSILRIRLSFALRAFLSLASFSAICLFIGPNVCGINFGASLSNLANLILPRNSFICAPSFRFILHLNQARLAANLALPQMFPGLICLPPLSFLPFAFFASPKP
ncbi:MAG: hypothetical protein WC634_03050 [archaeon]